jgi:hypothetical protein
MNHPEKISLTERTSYMCDAAAGPEKLSRIGSELKKS